MPAIPEWLRPGQCVVYFPRRQPELSEAWPVTSIKITPSGQTAIVKTDVGDEYRVHLPALTFHGLPRTGPLAPELLPVDDVRALAAAKRTNVIRAAEALCKAIAKHRPGRTMTNDQIYAAVSEIAFAADVARGDMRTLLS
jgi:hypothetical protein